MEARVLFLLNKEVVALPSVEKKKKSEKEKKRKKTKPRTKRVLTLEGVKEGLSQIAQGKYKDPFEADLRIKALEKLGNLLLKEQEAADKEPDTKIDEIKITVVDSADQKERIEKLEQEIREGTSSNGEA